MNTLLKDSFELSDDPVVHPDVIVVCGDEDEYDD